MIITLAEIKQLLQLGSDHDDVIAELIPIVQDFVIKYCNNFFELMPDKIYRTAITISFDSTLKTINDSDSRFVSAGFPSGLHCRVAGSKFNDGIYKIESVTAGTISLDDDETLIDESADGETVMSITVVKFPAGIKLPVSQMIGFNLDTKAMKGISSESLGDHSISYSSNGAYPDNILRGLNQYRKVSTPAERQRIYDIYTKRNP